MAQKSRNSSPIQSDDLFLRSQFLATKIKKTGVTESQTASSFLQLLTNALHDQHQIYDFILQNKTIMAALVRNGFLNKCYINQLQREHNAHTHQRCWADEQRKVSNY